MDSWNRKFQRNSKLNIKEIEKESDLFTWTFCFYRYRPEIVCSFEKHHDGSILFINTNLFINISFISVDTGDNMLDEKYLLISGILTNISNITRSSLATKY